MKQKYTISTIIYTYEDKPDNYLHCSRFTYVQSQEKQTETHRNSVLFFKKQLKLLWVNWPKMIGVIWQKFRLFNSAWVLEVALLLSAALTVADLSLQIQWFPCIYHVIMSLGVKNLIIQMMPVDKTVGYSIFKTSTATLCTCINRHSSFTGTGGSQVPLQDIQFRSKTIR